MAIQALPRTMFVRGTGEIEHHIAAGWTNAAFCGAPPSSRLGWTMGTESAVFGGVTDVCSECQETYRVIAESMVR